MLVRLFYFWIILVGLNLASLASAADFTEFLTLNANSPKISNQADSSVHATPGVSWGGGFTLGFNVYERFFVEFGLIYSSRNFSQKNGSAPPLEYALTWVQLPVVVRHWFSKTMSVGAGFYLSQAVGNVNYRQNGQLTILGYDQNDWSKNDSGAVFSFRYRTQLNELLYFVADERLNIGFNQVGLSNDKELRFFEFQSWVGIAVNL